LCSINHEYKYFKHYPVGEQVSVALKFSYFIREEPGLNPGGISLNVATDCWGS